jgi:hypothetical protein
MSVGFRDRVDRDRLGARQPPTWTPISVPTAYVRAAADQPSSNGRTVAQ